MSGRPVRNCKRRSAAEMLGLSPAGRSSNLKSDASPTKAPKKQKKEDEEEITEDDWNEKLSAVKGKGKKTVVNKDEVCSVSKKVPGVVLDKLKKAAPKKVVSPKKKAKTVAVQMKEEEESLLIEETEVFETDQLIDASEITETDHTALVQEAEVTIDTSNKVDEENVTFRQAEDVEHIEIIPSQIEQIEETARDIVNNYTEAIEVESSEIIPDQTISDQGIPTTEAPSASSVDTSASKVPIVLTVQSIKTRDKSKQIVTASLQPSISNTSYNAGSAVELELSETEEPLKVQPVTKTYILGKNNRIQELLTKPLKQDADSSRALDLQERTSLADAIELLTGNNEPDGAHNVESIGLLTVQKDSIKITDVANAEESHDESGEGVSISYVDSAEENAMNVVSDSDIIGHGESQVQIMPVYRSEGGVPQTFNVVITVPPGAGKFQSGKENATGYDSNLYIPGPPRKTTVDDELLPYCEVLNKPIQYNNQRAFIRCTVCPESADGYFGSVTQFCEHLRKDHSDKNIKPYKCTQCDYTCRVKGNLDQHVKFHSQDRPFTCHICHKGFIQKYKLNLHLKFHENRRDWPCEKCNSAFNDKQDLSRHMKNVHFKSEDGVKCPHCDRVFKNQYMLEQHIHVHTGEKNYKCEVCGKLYSTRESLRSHTKGHQFQFGCEICAKPLGSYSAFIAHKRLHDPNQKSHQCAICGKMLLFKATLEAHMKSVHSDERAYPCETCGKGFKTQGQLNNHMISHTKDKPYSCHVCGYAVKRKDSLRQHMYRHADVKPYRCGRCGKEYTQKQALEIHLKSKHAGVTTFNCTMCEKGFNTNYLLRKHMYRTHNVDMVQKMPRSEQVVIAQQEVEDAEDCEPPAPTEEGVLPPASKKQTVLINAHICEHCQEVFVSQHALAVHILSEHMNQKIVSCEEAVHIPTTSEDGQVVNISETIEIPIGEEMVLVQSVETGMLNDSLESGTSQIIETSGSTQDSSEGALVTVVETHEGSEHDQPTEVIIQDGVAE